MPSTQRQQASSPTTSRAAPSSAPDGLTDPLSGGELQDPLTERAPPTSGSSPTVASQGSGGADQQSSQAARSAVNEISTTMDEVDSMAKLQSKLGFLMDAVAPHDDMSRKLSVGISVKLHPALSVAFQFNATLQRTGGKLAVSTDVNFEAKGELDLWLAKIFAKVKLSGFINVKGNGGNECMNLIGAGFHTSVAAVSQDAADLMWGETYLEQVMADMDDEDYAEAGVGGDVAVGMSAGSEDDDEHASMEAGGGATLSQRLTRSGIRTHSTRAARLAASVGFRGGFKGKLSAEAGRDGDKPKGHILVEASRTADATEFMDQLAEGNIGEFLTSSVGNAAASIRSVIAGRFNPELAKGRTLGQALSLMGGASIGANVAGAALAKRASDQLEDFGAKVTQKLSIKLWWQGSDLKLDVNLDRVSTQSLGRDLKAAKLDVMIETVTRMINIPTISLA